MGRLADTPQLSKMSKLGNLSNLSKIYGVGGNPGLPLILEDKELKSIRRFEAF